MITEKLISAKIYPRKNYNNFFRVFQIRNVKKVRQAGYFDCSSTLSPTHKKSSMRDFKQIFALTNLGGIFA